VLLSVPSPNACNAPVSSQNGTSSSNPNDWQNIFTLLPKSHPPRSPPCRAPIYPDRRRPTIRWRWPRHVWEDELPAARRKRFPHIPPQSPTSHRPAILTRKRASWSATRCAMSASSLWAMSCTCSSRSLGLRIDDERNCSKPSTADTNESARLFRNAVRTFSDCSLRYSKDGREFSTASNNGSYPHAYWPVVNYGTPTIPHPPARHPTVKPARASSPP
jgi:hypothetical protein